MSLSTIGYSITKEDYGLVPIPQPSHPVLEIPETSLMEIYRQLTPSEPPQLTADDFIRVCSFAKPPLEKKPSALKLKIRRRR
ncbi:hypothetical protein P9112_003105 [Eukaryota sp. TZLM1-RC]